MTTPSLRKLLALCAAADRVRAEQPVSRCSAPHLVLSTHTPALVCADTSPLRAGVSCIGGRAGSDTMGKGPGTNGQDTSGAEPPVGQDIGQESVRMLWGVINSHGAAAVHHSGADDARRDARDQVRVPDRAHAASLGGRLVGLGSSSGSSTTSRRAAAAARHAEQLSGRKPPRRGAALGVARESRPMLDVLCHVPAAPYVSSTGEARWKNS